jgi:hypothetical protein
MPTAAKPQTRPQVERPSVWLDHGKAALSHFPFRGLRLAHVVGWTPSRTKERSPEERGEIGNTQSGNHIGVRVCNGHFDTRRIKKKRWMCGSAARVMLAQLHVQFKTRRRSTFEVGRPLTHSSTAGPANQPQAQRVSFGRCYLALLVLTRSSLVPRWIVGARMLQCSSLLFLYIVRASRCCG